MYNLRSTFVHGQLCTRLTFHGPGVLSSPPRLNISTFTMPASRVARTAIRIRFLQHTGDDEIG